MIAMIVVIVELRSMNERLQRRAPSGICRLAWSETSKNIHNLGPFYLFRMSVHALWFDFTPTNRGSERHIHTSRTETIEIGRHAGAHKCSATEESDAICPVPIQGRHSLRLNLRYLLISSRGVRRCEIGGCPIQISSLASISKWWVMPVDLGAGMERAALREYE